MIRCSCDTKPTQIALDQEGEHYQCESCRAMWGWSPTPTMPWGASRCNYYNTSEAVRQLEEHFVEGGN